MQFEKIKKELIYNRKDNITEFDRKYLDFFANEIKNAVLFDIIDDIRKSDLATLVNIYDNNRGSGNTYACVNGVKNTINSFLLVVNENQKRSTGLENKKQISLNSKDYILHSGRRFSIVVDNYTLQELYLRILNKLKEEKDEIHKQQKTNL